MANPKIIRTIMKTYFKLITAFLLICAPMAYSQGTPTETAQQTRAEAAKQAKQGIIDSVQDDDKAATLALLKTACQTYPEFAADFVAALLQAIFEANQASITARGLSAQGESPNVNTALVAEIVATAITAAGSGSSSSIISRALVVAPYAASSINLASANPLAIITQGLVGGSTLINPALNADAIGGPGGASAGSNLPN